MTKEEAKQTLERISQISGPINLGNYWEAIDMAIQALSEPSLPADLDEAADVYIGHSKEIDEGYEVSAKRTAFKAGAEWMAGQGITVDGVVCRNIKGYDVVRAEVPEKRFSLNEKVTVQIRKK